MPELAPPKLSVADLFAERDTRRERERADEETLKRRQEEELAEFRKRLDTFTLTQERVDAVAERIKRAFERGETELMLTSFPSGFCTDQGRAVGNVGAPPINRPGKQAGEAARVEPAWLATMPAGVRVVYEYWEQNLRPGGFAFSARIINYPGGMPGDIGLFLSWPKSAADLPGASARATDTRSA
ncbi:MAG TPA: hypothetical protein VME92_09105 [Acetobacteraceae bacterium]|nr:hypothetical protein [Acetobacteraceae bacterium]